MSIITLTTDFGYEDHYVGEMKGSILGINPKANLVDISHAISPQDIRQAAFTLSLSYKLFPKGTIHVIVVDPGVGSKRRILLAKTKQHYFIAPDNGILTFILKKEKHVTIREITNKHYFRKKVSTTFHGRDIMGPVAAHLSKKNIFVNVGKKVTKPIQLPIAKPKKGKTTIQGEIILVDHFGNLITNIEAAHLGRKKPKAIRVGKRQVKQFATNYAAIKKGQLLGIIGSSNFLEIAANGASAAQKLRAKVGQKVSVSL